MGTGQKSGPQACILPQSKVVRAGGSVSVYVCLSFPGSCTTVDCVEENKPENRISGKVPHVYDALMMLRYFAAPLGHQETPT